MALPEFRFLGRCLARAPSSWVYRLVAHCLSSSRSPKIGTGDALDDFYGIAVQQDGSVILAGDIDDDFYVTKLDAEGVVEWSFQVRFTAG